MFVFEGLLKAFVAMFLFNPVGWLCCVVAFWWCDYQTSTALSATFFGATTTAYGMWSLYGSKKVNVIWLVPLAIPLLGYVGLSVLVLNWVFISVGLNAAFQLARREKWFKRTPALSEPRW